MRSLVHSAQRIGYEGNRKDGFTLIGSSLRKHHINVRGFTLIELLVVISIIGILIGLSFVGFTNARQAARDGRRRTDLESIRSALVIYKSECTGVTGFTPYPGSLPDPFDDCKGNRLISALPVDPDVSRSYSYYSPAPGYGTFKICASLEVAPSTAYNVDNCPDCGGTGCNYSVTNP